MRRGLGLLLCAQLLLCVPTIFAQHQSGKLERVKFLGRDYVRLRDWASANNFKLNWLQKDHEIELSNQAFKLVFTADSRLAKINDINVWLSFPIAIRQGVCYIGLLDLETLVEPIVFPRRNGGRRSIRVIALDPGHGGKDTGICNGAYQEKKYTLLLAQEVREQLKQAGLTALLTRTTDSLVGLTARSELARRRGADLFVSLHFNGTDIAKTQVKGVEVYCLTPAGANSTNARNISNGVAPAQGNHFDGRNALLAFLMQESLVKNLGAEDRGMRRARFEVLREAAMPAILIEGGFLSHPVEGRKIVDPAYRRQMAQSIVKGLLAYKWLVEQ